MSRESRKMEHVSLALQQSDIQNNFFDDLVLLHNPISELNFYDLSLDSNIGGLSTSSPLFINAMTGGAPDTLHINQQFAIVANEMNIPMAVGSQMAAIKDPNLIHTYSIVRKENPHGIVIANLGQEATVEQALRAIEMIQANALQIHVNIMQELIMPEGDRNFEGLLKRIENIAKQIHIPLIVKEVGFGMPMDAVIKLKEIGVQIIDVGGKGGTNFAKIENQRGNDRFSFLNQWGLTTPISLLEASRVPGIQLIASGGIQNGLDVIKSIALGASLVGMAGTFLRQLIHNGVEGLIQYIEEIYEQLRVIMVATGAKSIAQVQKLPIVIKGETKEWCIARGIPTDHYAQRRM